MREWRCLSAPGHPELPGWLPGKWILSHHTMTDAGQTSDFSVGTGVIQIATTLTFTQGSPDYDYAGGPVGTGKGKVSVGRGVVRVTLWPTFVDSLPATVAKTPEGIVVEFSATAHGNEPSKFQAFYEGPFPSRGQEHPELPGWLPGKWILSHHTMTHAGRTSDLPAGTGQAATTLTFTQGSPDYDYAGGPVPPGKGKVWVSRGVVRVTLSPTFVFSPLATVAKTPEGIVVESGHGNETLKFQWFYKRAQNSSRAVSTEGATHSLELRAWSPTPIVPSCV